MANPPSPNQTFTGLGDLLQGQVDDQTEEMRKRRLAAAAGRPISSSLGLDIASFGGAISSAFGGGMGPGRTF